MSAAQQHHLIRRFLLPVVWTGLFAAWSMASEVAEKGTDPSAAGAKFSAEVAPVLQRRCIACHGPEKQEGGLRLDTGAAVRRGGDGGPVVVPGQVQPSRLWIAVSGGSSEIEQMPPEGPRLTAVELAALRTWIESGAVVPAQETAAPIRSRHWAFQRPTRPPLPTGRWDAWSTGAIDRLIADRWTEHQLSPSPEADRATLIRRASLDLLGLPPTPEEVIAFVADTRPDAYHRLLDRLLASPAYGERWGRHWLDAARYADSNGYTRDFGREIWKYREWVIAALNANLPFDQFTIEQFAGDLLPGATLNQRIATGFHRNTLINEEGGTDQEQFRVDAVADRVATTGEVYLGLTLICARCHSHKYDPISQIEFYQFFAFLNNCDEPAIEAPSPWQVQSGELERRARIREEIAALEKEVEAQRPQLEAQQREWEKTITPQQRARLPGPVQVAYDMPFEKRDAANKKMIEDYFRQSPEARGQFPALEKIAGLREREPKIPTTLVMQERAEQRPTHVHRRGDFLDKGDEVRPGVPAVLHSLPSGPQSNSRLALAQWLVDPANPLTPRVIANRYWQQLFGLGLVETDNDFGSQGSPPSHPAVLDWLAVEFVESGWDVKRLQRQMLGSATYRQASLRDPQTAAAERDPNNRWLSRQNRLRLEAEIVRDVALAASGLLTTTIGGPSVFPPQPDGVFEFTQDPKPWKVATGADRFRRGMYTHFWRSSPYPALMVFDAPNANVSCTRRLRSNTPLQALTLANDQQFLESARGLAERILREGSADPAKRVEYAFQLCLARSPSPAEAQRLAELIAQQQAHFAQQEAAARELLGDQTSPGVDRSEWAAWTAVSRVLLNLDEFITRE